MNHLYPSLSKPKVQQDNIFTNLWLRLVHGRILCYQRALCSSVASYANALWLVPSPEYLHWSHCCTLILAENKVVRDNKYVISEKDPGSLSTII